MLIHCNLLANVAQASGEARYHAVRRDFERAAVLHAFGLSNATPAPLLLDTRIISLPLAPAVLPRYPGVVLRAQRHDAVQHQLSLMGYGRYVDPYGFFSARTKWSWVQNRCAKTLTGCEPRSSAFASAKTLI